MRLDLTEIMHTFVCMKGFACLVAVLVPMLMSCGGRNSAPASDVKVPRVFVPALVPSAVTDEAARTQYMRDHYWDNVDFTDTLYLAEIDTMQMMEAFVGYVGRYVAPDDGAAMAALMKRASASKYAFDYFAMLAEKVLYDPNSPLRNDELYIPVLEAQVASPLLDKYEKMAPEYNLQLALQNRIGHKANDFRYTVASGRSGTLYGIDAEYTLIFFNNPGCAMCKQITEALSESPMIGEMVERGTLKVLALYPDEDLGEWEAYRNNIPRTWINAYDKGTTINNGHLYDLKAIPSLYLLDLQKRVLVKDSTDVGYIEYVIDHR